MENNIQLSISKLLVENKYRLDTGKDNTAVMVVDIPKVSEILANKMIEFAKLHVQAQQEAILENIEYDHDSAGNVIVTKDSIINAYPLNLIK